MTRNGLYKALAFTALAQQGKTLNDKLLETFSGQGKSLSYIATDLCTSVNIHKHFRIFLFPLKYSLKEYRGPIA